MTRAEHLAWCKQRAMEYVERGELHEAFASMASDLNKHPETLSHIGTQLGMQMLAAGLLNSPDDMRKWILGFN